MTDRAVILCSVCEPSVPPGHLHVHYRSHDSITAPRGNEDLFGLAFVIVLSCVADRPPLHQGRNRIKN